MLGLHNTETTEQKPPVAPPEPPKQEATGLDGYLEYLGIPKQEYDNEPVAEQPTGDSPFPGDSETAAEPEQPEDNTRPNGFNPDSYYAPSEIKTIENNVEFSMLPAESIVEVVDLGMVKGAELIAKEPQEGATDDEKEKLTKIWAMFLAGKNANISPGWMLLAMILLIYGPKFYGAWQIRKAKEEAEEAKRQAAQQRKRAERAEREAQRLRRERQQPQQPQQPQQSDIDEAVRRAMAEAMKAQAKTATVVPPEDIEDVTAGAQPSEDAEPKPKPKAKSKTKTTKK